MLEYTKVVLNQTLDDIKKISLIASFVTQGIYISYLIYAICASLGILYVNIPLLLISLAYMAFSIVMEKKTHNKTDSKIKAKTKEAYKVAKYIILAPTLITSIITLATLENDNITFSLLFTVMMIFGYIASVLMLIITKSVENRFALFMVAIKADMEPVINAYNTFRRFKGERVSESAPDKSEKKMRSDLDAKVEQVREELPKEQNTQTKMDKQELKEVRREIITSIASNVAEKAKQKFTSFMSKLSSGNTAPSKPADQMAIQAPNSTEEDEKEESVIK